MKALKQYLVIFFIFFIPLKINATNIDSLITNLNTQTKLKDKIITLNKIAWEYYFINIDSLFYYADLAEKINKNYYKKELAETYNYKGIYYELKVNPNLSLNYYLKAKNIQEKIKDTSGLAFTYTNIAWFYYSQNEYKTADEYHKKSYFYNQFLKDSLSMANNLIGMAVVNSYIDTITYENSLKYYKQAIEIYKKHNKSGLNSVYANLAKIYFEKKDYETATLYYDKALENSQQNDLELFRTVCFAKANIYNQKKQYTNAIKKLRESTIYVKQIGDINKLKYHYDFFAELFEKLNQYDSALFYYKKSQSISDSIFRLETKEKIADIETKYETEKKDKKLAENQLKIKNILTINQEAENKIQRLVLIVFIIAFMLIVFFFFYYQKQKTAKILSEKNQIISDNLKEKEILLGEIHHRVKNNLQLISTMLLLQASNSNDTKFKKMVNESRNRIQTMALIHQELYGHSNLSNIDMLHYIKNLLNKLLVSYGNDNIDIKLEIENINLSIDTSIPLALIINELFTNSIKYAFTNHFNKKPTIKIKLYEKNQELILIFSDNGGGYNTNVKQESFGTKLIQSFSRQLKAKIDIKSSSEGTIVTLIIKRYEKIN